MAKSKSNLTQKEIAQFYDYLCEYEANIKKDYGRFHFDAPNFQQFCKTNNIKPKGKNTKNQKDNSFWFSTHQDKGRKVNDIAHHLLRHIRNSFAHGLIKKAGENFVFEDYNTMTRQTMGGRMKKDLFWSFLKTLILTKK